MTYVLVNFIRNQEKIKLLVPEHIDISDLLEKIDDIFLLNEIMRIALLDFNRDYKNEINSSLNKVSNFKKIGIIGYPLDIYDAELYALDRKLNLSGKIDIDC